MTTLRLSLLSLLLFASACEGGEASPRAEVGTGYDTFTPVAPESLVTVVCGTQGGQHIWLSVRTQGLNAESAHVTLRIRFDDGSLAADHYICGQQLENVTLQKQGDWAEFTGVICFIPDPPSIHGPRLRAEGIVRDRFDRTASANVTFFANGPDSDCRVR
jgi:hypothetical protein